MIQELGLGIHGEPGARKGPLQPADSIVDSILTTIIDPATAYLPVEVRACVSGELKLRLWSCRQSCEGTASEAAPSSLLLKTGRLTAILTMRRFSKRARVFGRIFSSSRNTSGKSSVRTKLDQIARRNVEWMLWEMAESQFHRGPPSGYEPRSPCPLARVHLQRQPTQHSVSAAQSEL